MTIHAVRCKLTNEILATKLDGGWCACVSTDDCPEVKAKKLKLMDEPIVPFGNVETLHRQVQDMCMGQGRIARTVGFSILECPPFTVEEMADSWKRGWRMEDELIIEREREKVFNRKLRDEDVGS